MSNARRLRRLAPDHVLYERRVAGEPLRTLALDYDVTHTTLLRHFRRSDAVLELREARRRLQAKRKALHAEERQMKQYVRERAREDKKRDRLLEAWRPPRGSQPSDYVDWLNLRDAPRGLTSRQRYSTSDDSAKTAVEAGGGVEQVMQATGLRGLANIVRNIDPQIMRDALANDARLARKLRPDDRGLRRLVPDEALISRRALGETLRSIAPDYNVSHTTLSRYYERPKVAKQLRVQQRRHHPGGQEPQ
jgi:DNA invertase Pin-like site-specific DNA recombinase